MYSVDPNCHPLLGLTLYVYFCLCVRPSDPTVFAFPIASGSHMRISFFEDDTASFLDTAHMISSKPISLSQWMECVVSAQEAVGAALTMPEKSDVQDFLRKLLSAANEKLKAKQGAEAKATSTAAATAEQDEASVSVTGTLVEFYHRSLTLILGARTTTGQVSIGDVIRHCLVTATVLLASGRKSEKLAALFKFGAAGTSQSALVQLELSLLMRGLLVAVICASREARAAGKDFKGFAASAGDSVDRAVTSTLAAVWSAAGLKASDPIAYTKFGEWYNQGGFDVIPWLELLDLRKWTPPAV